MLGSSAIAVNVYKMSMVREAEVAWPRAACVDSASAVTMLRPLFAGLDREQFVVVLLDTKHRPIGVNVVAVGNLNTALVHPREVFRPAIAMPCAAIIVAHNHPSGDPSPSPEDVSLTRRLREAGEILGIPVLDHVILGDGERYYSFTDAGV